MTYALLGLIVLLVFTLGFVLMRLVKSQMALSLAESRLTDMKAQEEILRSAARSEFENLATRIKRFSGKK
jgi:uncharacterized membrane-anchored protein YhcB (DUF1043 family)